MMGLTTRDFIKKRPKIVCRCIFTAEDWPQRGCYRLLDVGVGGVRCALPRRAVCHVDACCVEHGRVVWRLVCDALVRNSGTEACACVEQRCALV